MFSKFRQIFFTGLTALLPLVLTLSLLIWFYQTLENFLHKLFLFIIPPEDYFPGLGVLIAIVATLVVGLFMNAWLARYLYSRGEKILSHIPLVKTVYTSLRDLMRFVTPSTEEKEHKSAVLVTLEGKQCIGLVTRDSLKDQPYLEPYLLTSGQETLCVYIPMSYQLGGFTIIVPKANVTPISMPIEQAMRFAVTAGMATTPPQILEN